MEQFQPYLEQLKQTLGTLAEIVVRGVFAMNLMQVLFGVVCLILLIPLRKKIAVWGQKADWSHDDDRYCWLTFFGWILWVTLLIVGLIVILTNGWKLIAPEFATIDYLLRVVKSVK